MAQNQVNRSLNGMDEPDFNGWNGADWRRGGRMATVANPQSRVAGE